MLAEIEGKISRRGQTVAKERHNHFGVYASVVTTGKINVRDEVQLK